MLHLLVIIALFDSIMERGYIIELVACSLSFLFFLRGNWVRLCSDPFMNDSGIDGRA